MKSYYPLRYLAFFFSVLIVQSLWAQKSIYFFHPVKNKIIEVHEGHYLSLQYSGYLGQTEFAKNVVTAITDSTITLGIEPQKLGIFGSSGSPLIPQYKVIRITDIKAFRRMTVGRQLVKSVCTIGAVIGSYFLLYDVYNSPSVSRGNAFLISVGVGVSSVILINAIFPERPKYKLSDGWQASVSENKPVFLKQ